MIMKTEMTNEMKGSTDIEDSEDETVPSSEAP